MLAVRPMPEHPLYLELVFSINVKPKFNTSVTTAGYYSLTGADECVSEPKHLIQGQ